MRDRTMGLRTRLLLVLILITLPACGRISSSSDTHLSQAESQKINIRSEAIHRSIGNLLKKQFPVAEDILWSRSTLSLDENWLVTSPEGLWGVEPDALSASATLDCNPNDKNCDPDFRRNLCQSDSDCPIEGTQCKPLEASVSSLEQSPQSMCLGRGDAMIDRFYKIMTSADEDLQLVSLSVPTGRYYTALIHALSRLNQKTGDRAPSVRLLFSGYLSTLPNVLNPTQKILDRITSDITALHPNHPLALRIDLAWLANGGLTWNHAKIVVADGKRAMTGGHNLIDADFLGDQPVADLSMEYEGRAVDQTRAFTNKLWSLVDKKVATFPKGSKRIEDLSFATSPQSEVRAITVGRLGAYGENASEIAISSLIDNAKTSVTIVQQEMYKFFVVPLARSFAYESVVAAAVRGVAVRIVLSNKDSLSGYTAVSPQKEYEDILDGVVKSLRRDQGLSKSTAERFACERVALAPFRFSRLVSKWPGKDGKAPSIHSKFVMADDASFYIGSHNLYPTNLVEFGTIVSDADAAFDVKRLFWNKIWQESEGAKIACPYS